MPVSRGLSGCDPSDVRVAVAAFLNEFCEPKRPVADDQDLFVTLGIEGDDAGDFIELFAERFQVDVTGYLWYFHHADEGINFGASFYKPIHRRFGRIPITLSMLTEAAHTKRWPIVYPEHVVPPRRWDIVINQMFAAATLVAVVVWAFINFAD